MLKKLTLALLLLCAADAQAQKSFVLFPGSDSTSKAAKLFNLEMDVRDMEMKLMLKDMMISSLEKKVMLLEWQAELLKEENKKSAVYRNKPKLP